jgi:hypothetical protein
LVKIKSAKSIHEEVVLYVGTVRISEKVHSLSPGER